MRILAIDYGLKRIGIATTDELRLTIRAVKTIPSHGVNQDAHRLLEIANQLNTKQLVIGLPTHHSDRSGVFLRRVLKLRDKLQKLSSLPVTVWNESWTTTAANQWMIEHHIPAKRRRQIRDQIAACLILEDFLSSQKHA
ncbi:MAG: Holliday junction resolvase RuvX [Acidobacteriota bacterium]|nr:Holliday junction resolvase RuvX [Blastocatellia bacterium]MDW8238197.1 Holliday junction resolvase RuvX [Acidobacteriota bacterium]